MATLGKKFALPIIPSVNPLEDSTQLDTIFFTDSDKIRFQSGKLRKVGGCIRIFSNTGQRIIGAARNVFSYRDASNNPITIIGTHRSLYANVGSNLASGLFSLTDGALIYNITPLQESTTTIADSLSTEYHSGVNVNITTTLGSATVSIAINQYLNTNEQLKITGVGSAVNGIPAASFNHTFPVTVISNELLQITTDALATSSGTVSVNLTWTTSYVYVAANGWGPSSNFPGIPGDRIKLTGATSIGGISDTEINVESIVTNAVNANLFVFQTNTFATSSVTNGGGGSTAIQYQILPGNIYQSGGGGYGGGEYGAGFYGDSKPFTNQSSNTGPRIWSMDKVINSSTSVGVTTNTTYLALTPGDAAGSATNDGSNVYIWAGNVDTAPILIKAGSPAAYVAPLFVKWLFVSHNAICTLGGDLPANSPTQGVLNQFLSSDQSDITQWIPDASNFANITLLDQAGPLISQASTRDQDLIFTEDEVYRMVYVGKPDVWAFYKLLTTDGIIAPKARVEIEDAVFWMGKGDFFVFNDTSLNVLPNNTLKRFVYDNINDAQNLQFFAFADTLFNEAWFFYCSGNDTSPNNYFMYNYIEQTYALGTWSRTAGEEPFNITDFPYMMESQNTNVFSVASNAVSTNYYTLGTDPLGTTNTSANVTFTVPSPLFLTVGDYVTLAGATDTNGIIAAHLNGIQVITAVSGTTVTFVAGGSATSTGSGGGSAITLATSILSVDVSTNNELNLRVDVGELVSLNNCLAFGGFSNTDLNVLNTAIRAINGSVIQIASANPSTVFCTSSASSNTVGIAFSYTGSSRLFQHEIGYNDYNPDYVYGSTTSPSIPLYAYATTNMASIGDNDGNNTMVIYTLYPDTNQTGDLTVTVTGKLYAQGPVIMPTLGNNSGIYTITPNTTKIDLMFIARQRQYKIESNVIDGNFLIGKWFEEVGPSSTR